LLFNQDTGSFSKYTLPLTNDFILDGLYYKKDSVNTIETPVLRNGEVITVDGEPVVLKDSNSTINLSNAQFLTLSSAESTSNGLFTFSSFTDNVNFKDFGKDYTGYVEFGFDAAGNIMKDSLKAPVIISHMQRTEDGFEIDPDDISNQDLILSNRSSCFLSYGWDWSTNYKNKFQIYRFKRNYVPSGSSDPFDYGVDVITTRNRIRGKGHSLGIKLESEAGKDCRVLGLGILYTAAEGI
jgi:hypothetical protein